MSRLLRMTVLFACLISLTPANISGQNVEINRPDVLRKIQSLKRSLSDVQRQLQELEATVQGGVAATTASRPTEVPAASSGPSSPSDTARQQCAAITKKGTRCSRKASQGSAYCWQHQ